VPDLRDFLAENILKYVHAVVIAVAPWKNDDAEIHNSKSLWRMADGI
jgi:hypothetical protein